MRGGLSSRLFFGVRMSKTNITTKEILKNYSNEILALREQGLGRRLVARELTRICGRYCSTGTMQNVLRHLEGNERVKSKVDIDVTPLDEDLETQIPIDELIQLRIKASHRKINRFQKHKRTIQLPAVPFGVLIFGDPHVDNESCDWQLLSEHVKLAQETEGVLATCVGDMQDNWIGRLARCYSEASVSASDGWRLSEWLLSSLQWLAIVGGNHDAWANGPGVDPMKLLTEKTGVLCYAPDEIRIVMKWKDHPDVEPIVMVIRHDFPGRSWFHPTHGPHKESMLDGQCHLLAAGHIHQWGELVTEQRHGRITNSLRVRGYKRADAYAMQKGFFEQQHGCAALVVINPLLDGPGRIKTFWDLEDGCQYLTYLRSFQKEETRLF